MASLSIIAEETAVPKAPCSIGQRGELGLKSGKDATPLPRAVAAIIDATRFDRE